MASNGIRDRVAIVGMGCTAFGEHWDKGVPDLLVEAATDALASARVALDDVDAFWLGTLWSGLSGLTLSRPLKIDYKPVSRVENFCATGSEAFRNACYAVASGAYDVAVPLCAEAVQPLPSDDRFDWRRVTLVPKGWPASEFRPPPVGFLPVGQKSVPTTSTPAGTSPLVAETTW